MRNIKRVLAVGSILFCFGFSNISYGGDNSPKGLEIVITNYLRSRMLSSHNADSMGALFKEINGILSDNDNADILKTIALSMEKVFPDRVAKLKFKALVDNGGWDRGIILEFFIGKWLYTSAKIPFNFLDSDVDLAMQPMESFMSDLSKIATRMKLIHDSHSSLTESLEAADQQIPHPSANGLEKNPRRETQQRASALLLPEDGKAPPPTGAHQ